MFHEKRDLALALRYGLCYRQIPASIATNSLSWALPVTNRNQLTSRRPSRPTGRFVIGLVVTLSLTTVGCHDGPLYALKVANPYFSMNEWKKDDALGVTDHERRKQLVVLADTIESMPAEKQQFWSAQLDKMIGSDSSAEMRRLAVQAAGNLSVGSAVPLIEKGLDDGSIKVRMEACKALARRGDEDSARMLVSAYGSETSEDVRHAALTALASHEHPLALNTLKTALADRNPATRHLAVQSLRDVTGKDYGDDPKVWIAALDGTPTPEIETRIADRVRDLF